MPWLPCTNKMLLSELGSVGETLESKFKETDLINSFGEESLGVKSMSGIELCSWSLSSVVSEENMVELYWEEKLLPGGKFIDASLE